MLRELGDAYIYLGMPYIYDERTLFYISIYGNNIPNRLYKSVKIPFVVG